MEKYCHELPCHELVEYHADANECQYLSILYNKIFINAMTVSEIATVISFKLVSTSDYQRIVE